MYISIYTFNGQDIAKVIDEKGNVIARYPVTEGRNINDAMGDDDWEF